MLSWLHLFGYTSLLLSAGYLFPFINNKKVTRLCSWILAMITALFSMAITTRTLPLVSMVIIVALQLMSMKIIVMVETYSTNNRMSVFQWLAFALGWFGMRPILFEKIPSHSLPYIHIAFKGVIRIIIGVALLYASAFLELFTIYTQFFVSELLMLAGFSLILHFGILNITTALWRALGANVTELFRMPYKSKSLKEFWGKRWNVAFSEMTSIVLYRPLKSKLGTDQALIISFLFSGLLHEIAISLPVRTGFGFPMLYFLIHASAMYIEMKLPFFQKVTNHVLWGRVWVITLLVVPLPLLFHHAFVSQILLPLRSMILHDLGA